MGRNRRPNGERRRLRGQAHVVGVALMVGLAVLALGSLTVGIATLVDAEAATADAERVADGFDRAIQGAERTGHYSHDVRFSEGRIQTEGRTLRILENGTLVERRAVDALVFDNDEYRVTAVAGAVVRDSGHSASLVTAPSITSSEETAVLVVSAPLLNTSHAGTGGQGGVRTSIETTVSHSRTDLGTGEFAVAIETETPGPFERFFRDGAATVERRTFEGDERESVVATYPGVRTGYLVTHDLQLEVT